jgi:hypothetical protein
MDFCARVQTEAGRRFRKTRLCERFLRRGEEIYWGSRVVVRGPGRVSFDTILLYLHIYTLQPNAFQNRFLDDFITSSVVSAPPRRKLFFDALHIYIYRERERETPATFARFAYIIIIIIIIIVSSKPRAALRRWTSTCPNRRRLVL